LLQAIYNFVNGKHLTSFSPSNSRTSIRRYSKCGVTTVRLRGSKSKISKTLVKAVNFYLPMMQVSTTGEAKPRQLKSLINTTTKDTCHEGKFSKNNAYTKVLATNATTMKVSCGCTQEDRREQWTTYEKRFKTTKDDLLKLGLAIDKPLFNDDNVTVEDVIILDYCKARMTNFDETGHPLSNEDNKGNPRARTYADPNLPRPGGNSMRGSRHTTGVYGTTTLGNIAPQLYIFNYRAQTEEGLRVNESSVKGLPKVYGGFFYPTIEEYSSFIAVHALGSMDEMLS